MCDHRLANGLEAAARVVIELLRVSGSIAVEQTIARPVVVVEQRPQILKVHRITTA